MAETNGHSTAFPAWMAPILRTYQVLTTRVGLSHLLGSTHDGMRQMEDLFGYKYRLTYLDYKRAYTRNDLAKRIVSTWPEETWGVTPIIHDDQEARTETPFETAWKDLEKRLGLYRNLELIDKLAQLGHYGCLLLGLRGQTNLEQPATPVRSADDLLFTQTYSEEMMQIQTFGQDPSAPNYGKPELYRLVGSGTFESTEAGLRRPVRPGLLVHASRVIHLPGQDGLDDPDIYGMPILEAVYNKLVDLMKVVGGSAEMYFRDAKRRIALEVQEGYSLTPEQATQLTQEAEEYQHGLRDFLRLMGVQAKDLSGNAVSPKDHFDVLMQTIAGTVHIPVRILLGSERGSLASSQDFNQYLSQVAKRQQNYINPRVLDPLLQRCVDLHLLPEPLQPWTIEWPNIWALSEVEQAAVTKDRALAIQAIAQALAQYRGPGMGDTVLSIEELRALMGPVWQGTEIPLTPTPPAEVTDQLLLSAPTEEPPAPDGPPTETPPAEAQAGGQP